jgi:hypothetical protein
LRRFVATLPGKALCHLVVMALTLPFLTLIFMGRAEAQIQTLPSWAVVDFINTSGKGGGKIGAMAADSMADELSKTGKYDVTPREQVSRAITQLNLVAPVTEATSLARLANEVQATSLVTGEVVNWEVRPVGSGKQADVIVRSVVRDVASGLPVNGSAQSASSSVRPGDTADDVLLNEAFSLVASKMVQDITNRLLPRGTVLNTFQETAFINQGTRSGFKDGQKLIVFRGVDQVATAVVVSADYDNSEIRIIRSYKGISPGDKVQVVFEVPEIQSTFTADGSAKPVVYHPPRNNNNFIQMIGAILILAFLMGGKGANGQQVVKNVRAEAGFDTLGELPGVKVSWGTNVFVQGNEQKFQFQIWRNDVVDTPVGITDGSQGSFVNTTVTNTVPFTWDTAPRTSVTVCAAGPTAQPPLTNIPVIAGVPYLYQVELIYRISALDFPNPPQGQQYCYYESDKHTAIGVATPLNQPQVIEPAQGINVTSKIPFTTQSVVTANPIICQYVLQLSSSPQFTAGTTETIGPITSNSTGVISMGLIDTFNGRKAVIQNATTIWWRIGARNEDDVPGPLPDASGQRYIFSVPRSFTRPNNPPPPPLALLPENKKHVS